MASKITELLDKSTNRDSAGFVTPSVVATVVGRDGRILYQHASGTGPDPGSQLTADTVFWLASQSKLMCTVASLIVVAQGRIGLDDDVAEILPDLAALPVLDGGEDATGKPTTKPRENEITLRLLLSHQSGVGYDVMPLSIAAWAKATGLKNTTLDSTQIAMKQCPLAFEPGTSWCYGAGIDWAGELVVRLTGSSLEDFYKDHIWEPLGMASSTFHPTQFHGRIVEPALRKEDGSVVPSPLPVPLEPPTETAGHGVWSTPNDYAKLLGTLLAGGHPILPEFLVDEIFRPQVAKPESISTEIHGIYKLALGPSIPVEQKMNHGLAGLINDSDFPGRRRHGTLQWSGMPNLIWWIDRESGIAATAFLQIMPVGDSKAANLNIQFENAVYAAYG